MKTTEFSIPGRNGYDIPLLTDMGDAHDRVLLCLHGFGGDKHSSVIAAVMRELDRDGIGVVTFDWPAHGDSPSADDALTVENCLSDLDAVLAYIGKTWPLPLSCFATSFGGYLATLYRNARPDSFDRLVLRSPALRMPHTFVDLLTDDERARLSAGEAVTVGFERTMELTEAFHRSLLAHDAFGAVPPAPERIRILQGDRDDVVMPEDTAAYAEKNGVRVEWFPGTDHRYKKDGDVDRIVAETRRFLLDGE